MRRHGARQCVSSYEDCVVEMSFIETFFFVFSFICMISCRLLDVVHHNAKLYLVFEYLDLDLKRYMDSIRASGGMSADQVKVGRLDMTCPLPLSDVCRGMY